MNTNFSVNGIILDTVNNESFLSFFKEDSIDASISIVNISDNDNNLYINGINVKNSIDLNNYDAFNTVLDASHNMVSYYIFTNSLNTFDSSITFKYNDETITVPIYNRPFNINNTTYMENSLSLNDNRTSSMLLRTNPKLTGNIKIVVDSSSKIYLDTFKVSDILSNKKYRKKEISSEEYYSNSIRNVFESLPKGDLYKINSESLNAYNVLKTFENQYDTTYIYGAKTNDDELYNENFSILAPLWINEILPDYFLIFKLDDPYEDNSNLSSIQIFKKYMSKAKLIKSFNLQANSPFGSFLRKHLSETNIYPGSIFIPFNNLDNLSWYGIAVDKGVVTERVETPYFINKVNNQIWADNYILEGFERNNLISSRLLNIEFMFNDDDSELFKINRYFGVYVKRNDFINGYYIQYYNSNTNLVESKFIDQNDFDTFFDSYTSNINIDINNSIEFIDSDRLLCGIESDNIVRLTNNDSIINYLKSNDLLNKPYNNIINTPISELNINKHPFITITLNKVLNPGEHLRILGSMKNGSYIIYEIIASNSELISNEPYIYNYNTLNETYENIQIFRISFNSNVDDYDDPISEQIKRIVDSFNKINEYNDYEIVTYNNNSISFINLNTDYNLLFQRINSNILNTSTASDNDITYFDNIVIPKTIIKINDYSELNNNKLIYLPIDFEYWGDRETYIVNFALGGIINNSNYNLYAINTDATKNINKITLYKNTNKSYSVLHNFEISYLTTDSNGNIDIDNKVNIYRNSVLNYNDLNTSIICTYNDKILITNNMFNGYSPTLISLSLLGYIPIKDFDFKIYDSTNINMNFNNEKILNFTNQYFNNLQSIIPSSNEYTYSYNDGKISTDYSNDKFLLKNRIYKVISGQGVIADKNNNLITIYKDDTFNTFEIGNGFNYLQASQEQNITIKLYNETSIYYNNSNINLTNESQDYFGNIFSITSNKEEALSIANNIFMNGNNFNVNIYQNIKDQYKYLQIPLVTPINNKWESIDLNCMGVKTELIWNLNDMISGPNNIISNFIPLNYNGISLFNNNLLYASYKYMYNDINKNKYIFADVNDVLYKDLSIRESINKNDTVGINTLMYYNSDLKNSKFTIGYYNKFTDIYEFTISGIKFNININNLSYLQNINLPNYNNYLISFILNPSKNKQSNNPIEIIINENNNTILIIWYQGNDDLSYYNRNYDTIYPKVNLDNNVELFKSIFDSSSLFQKERFIINYDNLSLYDASLICPISLELNNSYKNNLNNLGNNVVISQFNNNLYYKDYYVKYYNTTNDFLSFSYDKNNDYIVTKIYTNNNINYYNGYNTFQNKSTQQINYFINNNITGSYENYTINYPYNRNTNINVNNDSCSIALLKEIISKNLIDFYVIKNDSSIYINLYNDTILSETPINIQIIDPIVNNFIKDTSCYTYNGFYNPKMIRMFDFNFNESINTINLTGKNYVLCNTNVKNISDIEQLWINKVCDNSNELIEFDNQTISIDYINKFNIFSSTWDNNYYLNYKYIVGENNKFDYLLPEYYQGFKSSYEHKSYFGSKGIVLKNKNNNGSYIIKNWSKNNIIITNNVQNYNDNYNTSNIFNIKVNLTQSFIDQLLTNNTFVNNWKYFNAGSINNIIINYIKNSVLKYYIINNKNNLKIYYKEYNGNILEYSNNNFNNLITNINTEIIYENGNYYLILEVPDNNKYTYYFEFKIDRKNTVN